MVVVLEGPGDEEDARRTAQRILDSIRTDLLLAHGPLHVTTRIGVAFSADGNAAADRPFKHADMALYRAKRAGRNRIQLERFGTVDADETRSDAALAVIG